VAGHACAALAALVVRAAGGSGAAGATGGAELVGTVRGYWMRSEGGRYWLGDLRWHLWLWPLVDQSTSLEGQ
jgi:hypothetical protein